MKALKESAANNTYGYSNPHPSVLETFTAPIGGGLLVLHIEQPEFTSLCPLTGQPDFAKIVIDYTPQFKCVESKSLKLYLMRYRNHGAFHEECVNLIAEHLIQVLDPIALSVKGEFTPRGGIPFHPTVLYTKPISLPE